MSAASTTSSDDERNALLAVTPEDKCSEILTLFEEKGFVEAVSFLWNEVLEDEAKLEAEKAVISHDTDNKFYNLLVQNFKIKEHFSQVCSHRKFVKKSFERLKKYLTHMKADDAEKHDLTKFTMAQAVGYTARWVHGVDNKAWQSALEHHYCNEPHHPQYYGHGGRMEMRYLEESLVDMAACRWERQLGGAEDAQTRDLVTFNPVFLKRYHDEDREIIEDLIKRIQEEEEKKEE
ncbi:hypothetical protein FSP39_013420 [Pinctada imbricata]|uniref:Uncharacterized protein n=1 Tax=Pinctada imbricata TaxID=66713 RepID=A0AA89C9Y9_PINIB|nr:hypothetical protein FSP39_013420 [Pinctada imbricata]